MANKKYKIHYYICISSLSNQRRLAVGRFCTCSMNPSFRNCTRFRAHEFEVANDHHASCEREQIEDTPLSKLQDTTSTVRCYHCEGREISNTNLNLIDCNVSKIKLASMANHIAKTVCWANAEEWQRVATLLYSSDSKYVRSGVDHIAGWMSRGTVPLAVECTYHLLKVTLSDPDNGIFSVPNGSLICESSILRLAYSMALTRFVNGFCDAGQKGWVKVLLCEHWRTC